ncbi:MAG: ABC transporter ATP-binding protein [Alphaproteobacteria bacterium]|nr:ABC transporter ATP-binding protein [Alphaproteobacteria bacterium]
MVEPILAFEGVSIEHRGRRGVNRILDDVSLSIAPGEALGLVGESGCGKSTVALGAMRYLPAGMRVTTGRIRFEGRDLATMDEPSLQQLRGSRLAMVYQDPMSSLNPVMTIGRQLMEVPLLHGERDEDRARGRAVAMLHEVRLPDAEAMLARYPHQLSGGQQQRVVIAMALMAEPALLVMDEPTTGLDVTIEAAILELVRELRAKFGTAILFISHNLGTVARLCDRVGVLYAGRLVETGSVRDVFRAPAHPYTRGLLAALPDLDRAHGAGRLAPIAGTLRAEDRARPGCAFEPRCGFAEAGVCGRGPIALAPVAGDDAHRARCARLAALTTASDEAATPTANSNGDGPVLLEARGLTKWYQVGGGLMGGERRTVRALTEVDVEARRRGTLAIVGESGSGKSTFARVVAGLVGGASGTLRVDGAALEGGVDARPRELVRRVQMVFQNPDSTLNPSHSVGFALQRPLRVLRGLSADQAAVEARALMARVQLPAELMDRRPSQLSGGQRQRVAIARALAGNPDLLIADEPVSALDVSVQAAIVNLLGDLLAGSEMGLVLISHDLALVRHMADWVAVMYLGRVVEYGPAAQVFAPPYHPYTEALLAAAPRPDPDAAAPAVVLTGAMPSPTVEIKGCVFASRCPRKLGDICDREKPPERIHGPHRIACHIEM